eukprot:CAMPEP_0206212920 /NCGR_PEP_ID=MMETSP0047_2-20121206/840_1 /ASSEMBLY_ACC=CAM_ASM_000192 /TAXON_ID=195065 /ORGANISM="Chroomonas mesostigmatica_cf, Strain CCMP1168" /LENGTH=144 /DNA_ID=CAMNT_0053635023 /DNA_START=147 /DNA_END=578 /DNA_ORIENTATION=+
MADALTAGWLVELGLDDCIATFREEGIDSEALVCLEDQQLQMLGVKRMGDRTKLKAKANGVAVKVASPIKDTSSSATYNRSSSARKEGPVPEHLQVLSRLSASSPQPSGKPPGAKPAGPDIADRMSSTSFVLAGGPVEKYRQGG